MSDKTVQTMKVYRIQNSEGLGPYISTDTVKWRDADHYHGRDHLHPAPVYDGLTMGEFGRAHREQWVCGFLTMSDLYNWFSTAEIDALGCLGFGITDHKANKDRMLIGEHQIMFERCPIADP